MLFWVLYVIHILYLIEIILKKFKLKSNIEARRVDRVGKEKSKVPYIKSLGEKLNNEQVPIPKDVLQEMISLMNQANTKRNEYKSLKRKYDLKRVVRIKGSGYKYGKNINEPNGKNAKYDFFNATGMEVDLEEKKKELAQTLLNFLFLRTVYSNPEGSTDSTVKIEMCKDKTSDNFITEFFGEKFSLQLSDFENNGGLKDER